MAAVVVSRDLRGPAVGGRLTAGGDDVHTFPAGFNASSESPRRARGGRRRPARDAARGTGSTGRRRRPGRARPRCRGCLSGSGGGTTTAPGGFAPAPGAAELDTARGHGGRVLVVIPTGC